MGCVLCCEADAAGERTRNGSQRHAADTLGAARRGDLAAQRSVGIFRGSGRSRSRELPPRPRLRFNGQDVPEDQICGNTFVPWAFPTDPNRGDAASRSRSERLAAADIAAIGAQNYTAYSLPGGSASNWQPRRRLRSRSPVRPAIRTPAARDPSKPPLWRPPVPSYTANAHEDSDEVDPDEPPSVSSTRPPSAPSNVGAADDDGDEVVPGPDADGQSDETQHEFDTEGPGDDSRPQAAHVENDAAHDTRITVSSLPREK